MLFLTSQGCASNQMRPIQLIPHSLLRHRPRRSAVAPFLVANTQPFPKGRKYNSNQSNRKTNTWGSTCCFLVLTSKDLFPDDPSLFSKEDFRLEIEPRVGK